MLSTLQIFCFIHAPVNWRWWLWLSQCQRSINFNLITDFTVSLLTILLPEGIRRLHDNKFSTLPSTMGKIAQNCSFRWQIMTESDGKLNGKATLSNSQCKLSIDSAETRLMTSSIRRLVCVVALPNWELRHTKLHRLSKRMKLLVGKSAWKHCESFHFPFALLLLLRRWETRQTYLNGCFCQKELILAVA